MFFILPVAVDYRARRYPVVTFTLIGLNAAFYLIAWGFFLIASDDADPLVTNLGLVPADKTWWTWLTSMFVHVGFFHFVGNMIYLFLFGACVEDMMGRVRFTLFYLAGGLVANLSQVLLTTEPEAALPIVGASGAIATCIGAFLVVLPDTKINFRYFVWLFFRVFHGEFWLAAWIVIAVWFFLDFVSLVAHLGAVDAGGGVAFGAHVGGTVGGALAMWAMRGNLVERDGSKAGRPRAPSALPARSTPSAGDSATVYLLVDGKQVGPYAPAKLRAVAALGSFPKSARFRKEGMAEWRPLTEL